MKIKEKIIETSIQLFNQKKATAVSTAQIASALSISSGNLYYHFENKEHIIREIWQTQIEPAFDATYTQELYFSEIGYINTQWQKAAVISRYRFFFYELFTLLGNDPLLQEMYQKRNVKMINTVIEVFNSWIKIGMMRPLSDETKRVLAETNHTFVQTWTPFMQMTNSGMSIEDALRKSFNNLQVLMYPYFTEQSFERITILMDLLSGEPGENLSSI